MNDTYEEIVRRTYRYYYEDGLVEIGIGLLFTVVGLLLFTWKAVENGSWVGGLLAVGLMLLVIGGVYGVRWGVQQVKERITYPRTGYASYREGVPSRGRWVVVIAALLLAIASSFLPMVLQTMALMEGVLLAVILGYLGYRVNLTRFYVAAAVALLIGLVATLLFPDDVTGSAITFSGTGIVLLVGGMMAFINYLRHHPTADGGDHE